MGIMKEKKANEQAKKRIRTGGTVRATWARADADVLLRCIESVSKAGGAIRFGLTSDGGAYAVGIYGDGNPYTDYVRPNEDINQYLRDLADAWDPIAGP